MSSTVSALRSRRSFLAALATLTGVSALTGCSRHVATRPPNVLFIMADDLGYADLSCYGRRDYRTPRIDTLARQGVRLRQGYSNSAVCSPTRVALITGRYQYRLKAGLDEPISNDLDVGLPTGLPTLPEQFRRLGYVTALIGKWGMGETTAHGPLRSGYDRFFGIQGSVTDYFSHSLVDRDHDYGALYEGETPVRRVGYLTDLLADRAIQEIERATTARRPFFLSLHFTAPHWPWQGPGDAQSAGTLRDPRHLNGGSIAKYAEIVGSLDLNVGRVMAALVRLGIEDDTIVVFTSDNGGDRFSDTWPFIGAKTELLEGGIRVPLILRWPGRIPAGTVSDQVMVSMDFLPTLLVAAGGVPDPAFRSDGLPLLDVLAGKAPLRPRQLFWRYKSGDQAAHRDVDWKYLRIGGREYLFDLATDQRERANLAADRPDVMRRLQAQYAAWNAAMLPYEPGSYSHSVKEHDRWADRYD